MNSQEKKQRGILSLLVSGFLLLIIDLCAQNSQGGWGQSVSKGNDCHSRSFIIPQDSPASGTFTGLRWLKNQCSWQGVLIMSMLQKLTFWYAPAAVVGVFIG